MLKNLVFLTAFVTCLSCFANEKETLIDLSFDANSTVVDLDETPKAAPIKTELGALISPDPQLLEVQGGTAFGTAPKPEEVIEE